MNKNIILFLIHFPAWIVAFFFGFITVYISCPPTNISILIAISIPFTIYLLEIFYLFYYYLIPKYLEKRKYKRFALYSLSIIFIVSIFNMLMWYGIDDSFFLEKKFSYLNIMNSSLGIMVGAFFCGGLGAFYRFGIDWFKNLQVKKDLENKTLLSKLETLKTKLNPHLLFNTLNNIDTLIQTSPEQASRTLSKLSDILRYVVYETEDERVPIKKEIDTLQKYIALEKMRIVNPDSVEFISRVSDETTIPPMLFFPFVENGFKHSNLNKTDQNLKISITEDNSKITFFCSNTINENNKNGLASGMGLELVKKRLELLFPGTHILTILNVKNEFRVNLQIQTD